MMHNFDYKTIWDAFTKAASLVVAEGAFDAVRASLNDGHTVKINLGGQNSIEFSTIKDFNQWVQDTSEKAGSSFEG